MKDFGSIVSFELAGGYEEGNRFAEALEFFSITSSVGSTESLVMPPQLLGGQDYTAAQRAASLIGHGTVRLSIGIEDASDLIADLGQALTKAFAGMA
jgi:cystathionine beta-lyase/cystathionine gamma-synthase